MGTRNLITVYKDGVFKVAKYCQWDGYPTGQGEDIRKFLVGADMDKFRTQVDKVTWADDEYIEGKLKEIGIDGEWMDSAQAEKFRENYPEWSRDTGADILNLIMEKDSLKLADCIGFAKDTLFCEFAYVVDLDKNKLFVYGNGGSVSEDNHFESKLPLIRSIDFTDLPETREEWAELFNTGDDE